MVDSWVFGGPAAGTPGEQVKETVKFAGTRLFVEFARVKRRKSIRLKLYRNPRICHFDDSGVNKLSHNFSQRFSR